MKIEAREGKAKLTACVHGVQVSSSKFCSYKCPVNGLELWLKLHI